MKYSPKNFLGEYCPSRATFKILECCLVNVASNSAEKRPLSVCGGKGIMNRKILRSMKS